MENFLKIPLTLSREHGEVLVVDNPAELGPEWTLLAVVREDRPISIERTKLEFDPNQYNNERRLTWTDNTIGSVNRYLMVRSRDKTIKEQALKIEHLTEDRDSLTTANLHLVGENTKLKDDLRFAKHEVTLKEGQLEAEKNLNASNRKMVDRYEKDIAKLRAAIGEIEFKRIVEA